MNKTEREDFEKWFASFQDIGADLIWEAWRAGRRVERESCAAICDVTPPHPFRASIEAAHAIRTQGPVT